jgi:outer membrane protein assembly factor BamB
MDGSNVLPMPAPVFLTFLRGARRSVLGAVLVAAASSTSADPVDLVRAWPQWRGPFGNGFAPLANPPLTWSETNHVRWKIPLPGRGHSSPIVAGDRVYLMASEPVGEAQPPVFDSAPGVHDSVPVTHRHQYAVMAIDRSSGRLLWRRNVREEKPHEGGHTTGSPVSNSPVTDGSMVYAFFGSRGLYGLDSNGEVRWQADLGRMQTLHAHGEGSSPVLWRNTLFVNWDHEGDSFLQAFDAHTGSVRWKMPREEKTSWSTPIVVEVNGRFQVVVSATRKVRGYDAESGRLVWECAGLTDNVVSSPVLWRDLVIAGNSYYQQAMLAVRLPGAAGELTDGNAVAWRLTRMTPYVSSPLVYDDSLYFLRHNQNILSRLDPATGRPQSEPLRLEAIRDFIFASPVAAAGRIYVTGRDGVTVVLSHEAGNRTLAVNRLKDSFSASAALADGELFLRGERFLYCLSDR